MKIILLIIFIKINEKIMVIILKQMDFYIIFMDSFCINLPLMCQGSFYVHRHGIRT